VSLVVAVQTLVARLHSLHPHQVVLVMQGGPHQGLILPPVAAVRVALVLLARRAVLVASGYHRL
jgi:hypothetical protein